MLNTNSASHSTLIVYYINSALLYYIMYVKTFHTTHISETCLQHLLCTLEFHILHILRLLNHLSCYLVVHHMLYVRYVQAPGSHVCSYQQSGGGGGESGQVVSEEGEVEEEVVQGGEWSRVESCCYSDSAPVKALESLFLV